MYGQPWQPGIALQAVPEEQAFIYICAAGLMEVLYTYVTYTRNLTITVLKA
jgi:hypothetical protein